MYVLVGAKASWEQNINHSAYSVSLMLISDHSSLKDGTFHMHEKQLLRNCSEAIHQENIRFNSANMKPAVVAKNSLCIQGQNAYVSPGC